MGPRRSDAVEEHLESENLNGNHNWLQWGHGDQMPWKSGSPPDRLEQRDPRPSTREGCQTDQGSGDEACKGRRERALGAARGAYLGFFERSILIANELGTDYGLYYHFST